MSTDKDLVSDSSVIKQTDKWNVFIVCTIYYTTFNAFMDDLSEGIAQINATQ